MNDVPFEFHTLKDGFKCMNSALTAFVNVAHSTDKCPVFSIVTSDSKIKYTLNIALQNGEKVFCSFLLLAA